MSYGAHASCTADTPELGQDASVVDAFRAALVVAGDQRVLVCAGAVHPIAACPQAQADLAETRHFGLGQPIGDRAEEIVQRVAGACGHGYHSAVGDRGAEQFGQRLRGALLR